MFPYVYTTEHTLTKSVMESYLIHFGDSSEYRIDLPAGEPSELCDVKAKIEHFIDSAHPGLCGKKFYEKMSVRKISPEDLHNFSSYPEFGPDSVEEIKKVLDTEILDDLSVSELNLNAPFDED